MPPFVTVLLVIITMAVVPLLLAWIEGRRRREVEAVARRIGWQFTPEDVDGDDRRYADFQVFRRGYDRCARNTMQGAIELLTESGDRATLPVVAGDFRYKVKTNKGHAIQRFSYLLAALPTRHAGDLTIRPEGRFDKWKSAAGFDDIDFESAEFSDRFYVTASNKRFAYDVLHPRMMELFLEDEAPHVAVANGCLCLTQCEYLLGGSFERQCPAETFPQWIQWAEKFAAIWPRHLSVDPASRNAS